MKIVIKLKKFPLPIFIYVPLLFLQSKMLTKKIMGFQYSEEKYILVKSLYKELKQYIHKNGHFILASVKNKDIEVMIRL